MSEHSYEEIRSIAIDIIADREKVFYGAEQFTSLLSGIAEVIQRRDSSAVASDRRNTAYLSNHDAELAREVFWDLFRQGIITLGNNASNPAFPWFKVSSFGQRILANQSLYFFHDVSTFETLLKREIPRLDPVTMIYALESMQAFRAGCLLSSSVMLGVAIEHLFLLMLEAAEANAQFGSTFAPAAKERMILHKVNKFRDKLRSQLGNMPPELREDIDTQFAGILSVIRNFRNQSGHPSGIIIDREQMYVLLHLFIPHAKKILALTEFFRTS